MKTKLVGIGSYLPEKIIFNDDLSQLVETSDEWIQKRTGIVKRHVISESESTSFLGGEAAKLALLNANMHAADLDIIIVATCTADKTFPSCANLIQNLLNATNAFSFDVQAACAGFIYALAIADNFIKLGQVKNIMVIGADAMSKIVNWQDRATCVLFGDGAGAFILSSNADDDSGIISTHLFTDASLSELLYTNGGVSTTGNSGTIVMNGNAVFEHAVRKISEVILTTLEANKIIISDIDYFIIHQANIRILNLVAKNLQIKEEKIIVTIDQFANTSAASIPISWDKSQSKLKKGQLVMLVAMGAGFNWGAILMKV